MLVVVAVPVGGLVVVAVHAVVLVVAVVVDSEVLDELAVTD